jgi:hypothetical protein
MGRTTNYPDGSSLISSAYTPSPNGGTIGTFLFPIILGMIGAPIDTNSPLVRFAWPTLGAPHQDIFDDILYVSCLIKDEPYDKIREQNDDMSGTVGSPIFTPLFTDDFTPDENPLNPASWETGLDNYAPCQALSGTAQPTTTTKPFSLSLFIGGVLPASQYAQCTLAIAPTSASEAGIGILNDVTGDGGYSIFITDNGDGTQSITVLAGLAELYQQTAANLAVAGDTFMIGAVGGTVYALHNSVQFFSVVDNAYSSGMPFLEFGGDPGEVAVSNFVTGSVAAGSSAIDELWNYTRCWTIQFVAYGPNAEDNLRAVKSAMSQPYFTEQLAIGQLFPVPDAAAPRRTPEMHNAQWWERADFSQDMYEFVTESIERQAIASVEVIVQTADAVVADVTIPLPSPPIPPPPQNVIDGGGFDGTGGVGASPDGGGF